MYYVLLICYFGNHLAYGALVEDTIFMLSFSFST